MEVELRAIIDNPNALQDTLIQKGVRYVHSSYIKDVYFCKKTAMSVADVEMDEVGSYSLRLRLSQVDDNEITTLNTKTITSHGDHSAWEEHELQVYNFREATLILLATEFKPFFELEKYRHIFQYDGMEILVEEIKDFGGSVEVEIMCTAGEEQKAKAKIFDFLVHEIGLAESALVPKSVTNIIMKQRAFNQVIVF